MLSLSLSHDQHGQPTLIPLQNTRHFILLNLKSTLFIILAKQPPPVWQGTLITQASRLHSDKPQSVGLLRTSDQPVAETST